jgi:hypothetical protein
VSVSEQSTMFSEKTITIDEQNQKGLVKRLFLMNLTRQDSVTPPFDQLKQRENMMTHASCMQI